MRSSIALAAVAVLLCVVGGAVAGYQKAVVVDYGNEWVKVVIMNPHAKSVLSRLEMAINEQSNRKTPSVVGITGSGDTSERVLGEDAAGLLYRAPSDAYAYLKRVLGQYRDSAAVASFEADCSPASTHSLVASGARKTVAFTRGSSTVTVEELIVSLLQWCKRVAEAHVLSNNGETTTISDAVLIVPEHWTAKQRTLYSQLATVAGLSVKGTVNELTAVAVDYGNRNLGDATAWPVGTTKSVLFYTVGAHGTVASVIEYTKTGDAAFKVKVLGTAFDAETGGLDYDLAVREHLIAEFDTKNKKKNLPSIRGNKKAMAKLLREARDLKEQLSAGAIASIQVEEIYEGLDFATTLTRDKFEDLVRSLLTKSVAPIRELFNRESTKAALTNDVRLIELYGGGVRIPALQALIVADFPTLSPNGVAGLGKHVDGDEAAVFGAGLVAANWNSVPGTKKVELDDPHVNTVGASADELSDAEITTLRDVLKRFDELAARRAAVQEARNKLETLLVEYRERLDTLGSKLAEADRESLQALVSGTADFLEYEAGAATTAADYDAKLTTLKSTAAPLLKTALEKWNKEQEKVKAKEAADEKARLKEVSKKARERAQDKAYARAQAAKEQQNDKPKKADKKADKKPADKKKGKKADKTEL